MTIPVGLSGDPLLFLYVLSLFPSLSPLSLSFSLFLFLSISSLSISSLSLSLSVKEIQGQYISVNLI